MKLKIKVIPRAKKERVERSGEQVKVYLSEPARDGKANKRLKVVLADYFRVRKSEISIIKGEKSREKVVSVGED
ncbi:MAG: DUF167 domain-containing protein [Candidatus Omnitrophica bacterium]|nr:DUF167 domain-containing protein [Candidatus Omnitrophota bacterium]